METYLIVGYLLVLGVVALTFCYCDDGDFRG